MPRYEGMSMHKNNHETLFPVSVYRPIWERDTGRRRKSLMGRAARHHHLVQAIKYIY